MSFSPVIPMVVALTLTAITAVVLGIHLRLTRQTEAKLRGRIAKLTGAIEQHRRSIQTIWDLENARPTPNVVPIPMDHSYYSSGPVRGSHEELEMAALPSRRYSPTPDESPRTFGVSMYPLFGSVMERPRPTRARPTQPPTPYAPTLYAPRSWV
ncbi:hypothetical protein GGR53DRAFT_528465 [Hypoxylon sp. FL1150]|nr:hypothetical protein GGR53DRAFT_528465 [Hypoxylon sp. FL1150]